MRRMTRTVLLSLAVTATIHAQDPKPLTPADYGQWETLVVAGAAGRRGGARNAGRSSLSPDGKWLAYGINRSNRNNELRITNIADGTTRTAAFGTQPAFSADSLWAAYAIGYSEAEEDKLKKEKKPAEQKLGLLKLAGGEPSVVEGVASFAFSPNGTHLAMRRYPAERTESAAGSDEADAAPGSTLIVRDLTTGRDTTFGNVSEYAWQDLPRRGKLLAMTIRAEGNVGNGVHLFDPASGTLRVLDSSTSVYSGLSWREKSADLAVLRSRNVERREGPTQVALVWRRLGEANEAARVYDPATDPQFPAAMRTVSFRKPSWSDDGAIVFLGIAPWEETAEPAAPAGAKDASGKTGSPAGNDAEPASVDVWHTRDVDVLPKQKAGARSDRQRNLLAAWHLGTGRFVPLANGFSEQVTPIRGRAFAFAADWSAYAMERSMGRPAADLYLVDLETGDRKKVKDRLIEDRSVRASPGGRYLLYFDEDHYWTVDTTTLAVVNITRKVPATFVDRESDSTSARKPPFGIAGWTKDDRAVILYDRFDLWQVTPDGGQAVRLTDGAAEEVRHRYVQLDPDTEWIDPEQPVYVSLFGIWTKKSGYARLQPDKSGALREEHLVWEDRSLQRLARAEDADVYLYVAEAFDDSPDVFIGGPELKGAKQVTATNPFQSRYAWGHAELVEYENDLGRRLQGALFYPAGYQPGVRYPMVVYLYERLSDGLHRYSAPSERDYYNAAVFTQNGYFYFQPDIVFRPREPGVSVAGCVVPAVKAVIRTGRVDPARIGVLGHSWGGFDSTYLATHTDTFAAAVAGAPITDLISNYGNHHWSSGIAETDHIETGQQRMEVPLWEDLQAYIRNSAVFNAQNMKTPLLVEVGDSDGTVFWHQGVELYNIARRAGRDMVLLVYAGEDHGLRKKQNQVDYHRRILQWFGHYLKGEPGPEWITKGVRYLDRERELKNLKSRKGGS